MVWRYADTIAMRPHLKWLTKRIVYELQHRHRATPALQKHQRQSQPWETLLQRTAVADWRQQRCSGQQRQVAEVNSVGQQQKTWKGLQLAAEAAAKMKSY